MVAVQTHGLDGGTDSAEIVGARIDVHSTENGFNSRSHHVGRDSLKTRRGDDASI
jgi:hypothetical protein